MYNLFDGHPEVAWLVDEGFLYEYLYDLGPGAAHLLLDAIPDDVDALIGGLRDKQIIPPLHLPYEQSLRRGSVSETEIAAPWDEEAFRRSLEKSRSPGVAGLWRWLVEACLAGMGEAPKRFACMKSPDYAKSAVGVLDTVQSARALVIFRDPLYSIDSLKRSRELRNEKLLTWPLIAQIVRAFQEMHERVRTASADILKPVRYESLVVDPKSVMSGVASWLGIEFDACLLEPTMRGQQWPGISSFESTEGIDSSPAERLIQSLTCAEQKFIRTHLADFRAEFDYA